MEDMIDTIEKTKSLNPDRLAFYSYAHVPWIKGNGQRGFRDEDVPKDDEKRKLYEVGKSLLLENGYFEIGMDHFATKEDTLYTAFKNHQLHRNFMGYSASKTQLMIGLGVSSISDSWYGFAQNTKSLDEYYFMLENHKIPVVKGHLLSTEDLMIRRHILNTMCQFKTNWNSKTTYFKEVKGIVEELQEMVEDGLIEIHNNELLILEKGKPFVRNVCMAFDLRLKRKKPETQLFSMTI
jgi:oxygen-independent coproporphyrinogen-3 oxidase